MFQDLWLRCNLVTPVKTERQRVYTAYHPGIKDYLGLLKITVQRGLDLIIMERKKTTLLITHREFVKQHRMYETS